MEGKCRSVVLILLLSLSSHFICPATAIMLSESEQITLEASGTLIPSPEKAANVSVHLREIRRFCPAVATVFHDPKWEAGELIMPWMELNKDHGKNIPAINASEFGPIISTSPSEIFPDALFQFPRPYNPTVLCQIIENMYGYKNSPNFNTKKVKNQIFYFVPKDFPAAIHYCVRKSWMTENKICTRVWEFRVVEGRTGLKVSLVREYGDGL